MIRHLEPLEPAVLMTCMSLLDSAVGPAFDRVSRDLMSRSWRRFFRKGKGSFLGSDERVEPCYKGQKSRGSSMEFGPRKHNMYGS